MEWFYQSEAIRKEKSAGERKSDDKREKNHPIIPNSFLLVLSQMEVNQKDLGKGKGKEHNLDKQGSHWLAIPESCCGFGIIKKVQILNSAVCLQADEGIRLKWKTGSNVQVCQSALECESLSGCLFLIFFSLPCSLCQLKLLFSILSSRLSGIHKSWQAF